uniref:Ycf89 n=1 Tax=Plagiogramma staurophorum TaxID=1003089 RepID=A0A2U9NN87_9STRA|nr:hypothetical protein ycf89 [Plagiogramma staurophorum]YP_009495917.1 hypothetical protein ycf88 [Plagiogramma staurophorum]AWT38301.1 hypothetical protein ycf89 [Plagiogramma staurophorum]AWT38356.1 hypothetical protein ycf88 [Plagiogramma staurophorum]
MILSNYERNLIMNLSKEIATQFYSSTEAIIKKIADFFGYPDNPGMPFRTQFSYFEQQRFDQLPMHDVRFPPEPVPDNIGEVIFGVLPKLDLIQKIFYESSTDGYYNFYIKDYKNLYFLPDWLSKIIQLQFHVCLDTSGLEAIREVVFISLLVYINLLNLRLAMYWFLSINPYTYPWLILVSLVDWTEEVFQGLVPVVGGINLTASFWFTIIGKWADSLNHLVFTMPFLPSEAQRGETIMNGEMVPILMFRFFPILWFKEGIPNDIREFWYSQRPDILEFMQKSYGQLNITLLPDSIINSQHLVDPNNSINVEEVTDITKNISTQVLSNANDALLPITEFNNYLIQLNDSFHHLVLPSLK